MDGRLILGIINYLILALIILFGSLALIVKNQRKKLTCLFLMFLCSGIISYLFFAGIAFIIPGMILIFFTVLLFLLVFNQEFFGAGKKPGRKETSMAKAKDLNIAYLDIAYLPNLVIAILFCLGTGYLLFIYTGQFYQGIEYVEEFSTISLTGIINYISSNYLPAVFLLAGALTISIIWFIGILKNRRGES